MLTVVVIVNNDCLHCDSDFLGLLFDSYCKLCLVQERELLVK